MKYRQFIFLSYTASSIIANKLQDFPTKFSHLSRVLLIGYPLHITPLDGVRRTPYRASHSLVGTHPSDGLFATQRCQRELVLER